MRKHTRELNDQTIRSAIEPYGIALDDAQVEAVHRYVSLLVLWNQKVNLTSLTDANEILGRHFGESMFACAAVPITSGRLADVGSGAGFPGLALKIACPRLELTLIEPNAKKAAFLAEACRALGFTARILREPIKKNHPIIHASDFITARAIGNLPTLLGWSSEMLRKGGQIVLWLGADHATKLSSTAGWTWHKPISIPLSQRRVLLVGAPRID